MARRFILILMTVLSTVIMAQRPSGGQRPSGARPDMADRPKIGVVFGSVEDGDSGTPIEFATISILAFDEDKVPASVEFPWQLLALLIIVQFLELRLEHAFPFTAELLPGRLFLPQLSRGLGMLFLVDIS